MWFGVAQTVEDTKKCVPVISWVALSTRNEILAWNLGGLETESEKAIFVGSTSGKIT